MVECFNPIIFTDAAGRLIPVSSFNALSFILNVNKDGTAGKMVWPMEAKIVQIDGLLPAVIIK
jgi:hypothetical protein